MTAQRGRADAHGPRFGVGVRPVRCVAPAEPDGREVVSHLPTDLLGSAFEPPAGPPSGPSSRLPGRVVPTERHTELVQVLRLGVITTTVLSRRRTKADDCGTTADRGRTMSNISAERVGVIPVRPAALRPGTGWPEPPRHRRHARIRVAPAGATRSDRIARSIDLVGASIGLLVAAPILLVVAALIRGSSRGPVVFRHERLGKDLEPFRCLKFRTMHRELGTDHRGASPDPARDRRRVLQQLQAQRRPAGHPTRAVPAQVEPR